MLLCIMKILGFLSGGLYFSKDPACIACKAIRGCFVALLVSALFVCPKSCIGKDHLAAETIYLKDGSLLRNVTFLGSKKDTISIKMQDGRVRNYKKDQIAFINWNDSIKSVKECVIKSLYLPSYGQYCSGRTAAFWGTLGLNIAALAGIYFTFDNFQTARANVNNPSQEEQRLRAALANGEAIGAELESINREIAQREQAQTQALQYFYYSLAFTFLVYGWSAFDTWYNHPYRKLTRKGSNMRRWEKPAARLSIHFQFLPNERGRQEASLGMSSSF